MQYNHRDYLQGRSRLKYVEDNKQLQLFEYDLISNPRNYPSDIVNKLHQCFYQVDITRLTTLQIKRQHDPTFHRYMQYFCHSLISQSDILPDLRLRRLYTSIYPMSDRRTTYVMKCQKHPLFVVKVNTDDNDYVPHQALIGFEVSNNLRMTVPNFIQTYEVYYCKFPLTKSDSAVWSVSDKGPGAILLLEYVYDSISLEKLAPSLTKDEFLQIYIQVVNALNIAHKRYRFTHYDMHAGNILVQRLATPMSIPIHDKKGNPAYLSTMVLARIIDMEFAYAIISGHNFGVSGLQEYNVFSNRSFPMHDAYKLLLFTYEASLSNSAQHNQLTSTAQVIYDFFNEKKTLRQRVLERKSNLANDFYQPDLKHIRRTHDELLQYLCSNFNLAFSVGSPDYSYTPISFTDYLLTSRSCNNLVNYYLSNGTGDTSSFNKEKAYRRENKQMRKLLRCTIRDIKQYEKDRFTEASTSSGYSSDDTYYNRKSIIDTLHLGERVIRCKLWLLAVYYALRQYPQEICEQAMIIDEYYAAIMNDIEL